MTGGFLGPECWAQPERANCVVIPVPFDATTCYKSGARDGPAAILAASPHMELYDEDADCQGWRWGIHTDGPVEPRLPPEAMTAAVEERVEGWLSRGRFPVLLGGDHSISIGAMRACARRFPGLVVVQLDAHTDLRDSYQGSPLSHACVMRRALEAGASICQVGIRSTSPEELAFMEERGLRPIWAREVWEDLEAAAARLLGAVAGRPIYLTIDLDCLDPSIMPAVGTPEPGGLQWYPLIHLLETVVEGGDVVALDLVELAPIPGLHAADYLAARLLYKLISLLFRRRVGSPREDGDGRR